MILQEARIGRAQIFETENCCHREDRVDSSSGICYDCGQKVAEPVWRQRGDSEMPSGIEGIDALRRQATGVDPIPPRDIAIDALSRIAPRVEYRAGDRVCIPVPESWTVAHIESFAEACRAIFPEAHIVIAPIGDRIQVIGKAKE